MLRGEAEEVGDDAGLAVGGELCTKVGEGGGAAGGVGAAELVDGLFGDFDGGVDVAECEVGFG